VIHAARSDVCRCGFKTLVAASSNGNTSTSSGPTASPNNPASMDEPSGEVIETPDPRITL
jgi:hypothetical protein